LFLCGFGAEVLRYDLQECFHCSFGAFGDPAFLSGKFGRKDSL